MSFFFFTDTATTEIYTLSLHDALPICLDELADRDRALAFDVGWARLELDPVRLLQLELGGVLRSEEHTSELQSRFDLVCRLLLEKKKKIITSPLHCNELMTPGLLIPAS